MGRMGRKRRKRRRDSGRRSFGVGFGGRTTTTNTAPLSNSMKSMTVDAFGEEQKATLCIRN